MIDIHFSVVKLLMLMCICIYTIILIIYLVNIDLYTKIMIFFAGCFLLNCKFPLHIIVHQEQNCTNLVP